MNKKIHIKQLMIAIVCLIAIVSIGLAYLYFGGGKNYINNNIPAQYKYTQRSEIIPDEFEIPKIKKQMGDTMEYVVGEEYDNQYVYEQEGTFYCTDTNIEPEIITYYFQGPAGYWIFAKMGGYSSRAAFTCGDVYVIYDFGSAMGDRVYGPFELQ